MASAATKRLPGIPASRCIGPTLHDGRMRAALILSWFYDIARPPKPGTHRLLAGGFVLGQPSRRRRRPRPVDVLRRPALEPRPPGPSMGFGTTDEFGWEPTFHVVAPPTGDTQGGCIVDLKLELVLIPVSDVDKAKAFYAEKLGFNLDVDHRPNEEFRVVQLTPPGSACSIAIGKGITDAAPGSYKGTHLVVSDIEVVRDQLRERGVDVSEIRHLEPGGWVPGPDPERRDYSSFADFSDPDGNTWILQERGRAQRA